MINAERRPLRRPRPLRCPPRGEGGPGRGRGVGRRWSRTSTPWVTASAAAPSSSRTCRSSGSSRCAPWSGRPSTRCSAGEVRFVPERWEKTLLPLDGEPARLDHLAPDLVGASHPRLVLRRLRRGHRGPRGTRRACACGSADPAPGQDVLDTWFSSALLPFSTLGWPDDTADFRAFYPNAVLVTAYDIIYFWVARMIQMGLHFTGGQPFADVVIHGLIQAADSARCPSRWATPSTPSTGGPSTGPTPSAWRWCQAASPSHDTSPSSSTRSMRRAASATSCGTPFASRCAPAAKARCPPTGGYPGAPVAGGALDPVPPPRGDRPDRRAVRRVPLQRGLRHAVQLRLGRGRSTGTSSWPRPRCAGTTPGTGPHSGRGAARSAEAAPPDHAVPHRGAVVAPGGRGLLAAAPGRASGIRRAPAGFAVFRSWWARFADSGPSTASRRAHPLEVDGADPEGSPRPGGSPSCEAWPRSTPRWGRRPGATRFTRMLAGRSRHSFPSRGSSTSRAERDRLDRETVDSRPRRCQPIRGQAGQSAVRRTRRPPTWWPRSAPGWPNSSAACSAKLTAQRSDLG